MTSLKGAKMRVYVRRQILTGQNPHHRCWISSQNCKKIESGGRYRSHTPQVSLHILPVVFVNLQRCIIVQTYFDKLTSSSCDVMTLCYDSTDRLFVLQHLFITYSENPLNFPGKVSPVYWQKFLRLALLLRKDLNQVCHDASSPVHIINLWRHHDVYVLTRCTPGYFCASEMSTETILAELYLELIRYPYNCLCNFRSFVYLASPLACKAAHLQRFHNEFSSNFIQKNKDKSS